MDVVEPVPGSLRVVVLRHVLAGSELLLTYGPNYSRNHYDGRSAQSG